MQPLPSTPEDAAWLVRAGKSTGLFAGLDMAMIERVLSRFKLFTAEAGEKIVKEGADDTGLYFLYAGKVKVSRARMLILSESVGDLKPGDFFGEMALLVNGSKRTATVSAVEPCKVYALAGHDFHDLLAANPAFCANMRSVAAHRKAELR